MGQEGEKKALVIRLPPEGDLGDLVQIARAIGKKLFRGCSVRVVEAYPTRVVDEWAVVVQASEVVSGPEVKR